MMVSGHQSGITKKGRSGQVCEYKFARSNEPVGRLYMAIGPTSPHPEVTSITA